MKLMPGDTVLVRIKAFRADRKITDRWEQKPYIVLKQILNQLVFKVKPLMMTMKVYKNFASQ